VKKIKGGREQTERKIAAALFFVLIAFTILGRFNIFQKVNGFIYLFIFECGGKRLGKREIK
jgi:hypothetical protein